MNGECKVKRIQQPGIRMSTTYPGSLLMDNCAPEDSDCQLLKERVLGVGVVVAVYLQGCDTKQAGGELRMGRGPSVNRSLTMLPQLHRDTLLRACYQESILSS